jgi:nucleotide-binding universal stress UspA family protein
MTSISTGSAPVIVVGADGSPSSTAALRWAGRQARATGASLRVITAWHYPSAYGLEVGLASEWRPDQEAVGVQADALKAAADEVGGLLVETSVIEGETARVLVKASEQADLLVVGNRGHGELSGILLGSVSEYCVAHADCPVVVVRARHAPSRTA